MEEKKKVPELTHQFTLSNRNLLALEGVTNLVGYDQELIVLETNAGVLEVKGDQLHVQQLNLEQGRVLVDGEVISLVYTDQSLSKRGKGFFGKLIK